MPAVWRALLLPRLPRGRLEQLLQLRVQRLVFGAAGTAFHGEARYESLLDGRFHLAAAARPFDRSDLDLLVCGVRELRGVEVLQ